MAGDETRTRIVFDMDRKVEPKWFLLRSPHRIVIDLPRSDFAIGTEAVEARGLIGKVRYGDMDDDHSRMILTTDGPIMVEDLSVLENENSPGYRLIVDIVAGSEETFEAAMKARIGEAPDEKRPDTPPVRPHEGSNEGNKFTLVIDPGHGGIDGGTRGVNGTSEKQITLAFALELKNKLDETGAYHVVLTRNRDVFLRLDERVRIARQNDADLLISIHADAISVRNFRGATIYTLSERASDAEAAATAARENLSDQLAGMTVEAESDEVADILVDLIRRETHAFSIRFARTLLGELTNAVDVVNNPLRSAGFKVLRAPDVPSILLELGYLSNPKDEALMRDAEWRGRAAENIVRAIEAFVAAKTGAGG
ncbi:N-acetylmuramoyl-L-alanine amidase [Nitratireductor luteus]|uniref:N-acetylmuramoyl-L-alanine amidase n=1 Tax=Nitratireductor luteus TaxID=2976980 RepID=UPI002240AC68|nr:N-acetylmuramoyl-L-alanine amidase [Nitratireductor luteus]